MSRLLHVNFPYTIDGTQHDTNGSILEGPFNGGRPMTRLSCTTLHDKKLPRMHKETNSGPADESNRNSQNIAYEQTGNSSLEPLKMLCE